MHPNEIHEMMNIAKYSDDSQKLTKLIVFNSKISVSIRKYLRLAVSKKNKPKALSHITNEQICNIIIKNKNCPPELKLFL